MTDTLVSEPVVKGRILGAIRGFNPFNPAEAEARSPLGEAG